MSFLLARSLLSIGRRRRHSTGWCRLLSRSFSICRRLWGSTQTILSREKGMEISGALAFSYLPWKLHSSDRGNHDVAFTGARARCASVRAALPVGSQAGDKADVTGRHELMVTKMGSHGLASSNNMHFKSLQVTNSVSGCREGSLWAGGTSERWWGRDGPCTGQAEIPLSARQPADTARVSLPQTFLMCLDSSMVESAREAAQRRLGTRPVLGPAC